MNMDTLQIAEQAISVIHSRYPHLKFVKNLDDPVELSVTIPVQPGLAHKIWLALQNDDELSFGVGSFQVEWFPCTDRSRVEGYIQAVCGFLSGKYRILEHYRGSHCIKAQLQRPLDDGTWKTESTWSKLWWRPFMRKEYKEVRNV